MKDSLNNKENQTNLANRSLKLNPILCVCVWLCVWVCVRAQGLQLAKSSAVPVYKLSNQPDPRGKLAKIYTKAYSSRVCVSNDVLMHRFHHHCSPLPFSPFSHSACWMYASCRSASLNPSSYPCSSSQIRLHHPSVMLLRCQSTLNGFSLDLSSTKSRQCPVEHTQTSQGEQWLQSGGGGPGNLWLSTIFTTPKTTV